MILVDSSVWVDFFNSTPSPAGAELRRLISNQEPCALTGLVVTEVLQGLTRDVTRIERYLTQWPMLEPAGFPTYRAAAVIYRTARSKGLTVTTIDSVIAQIALEQDVDLFTTDQDFLRIAPLIGLSLYRSSTRGRPRGN